MNPTVRLIAVTTPVEDPDYEESLGLMDGLDLIEYAGRWDYGAKSVAKMQAPHGDGSCKILDCGCSESAKNKIIGRWLNSGEESMVEMADAVFLIECSRVVSHELVRHRIASYQQESQRFVSYRDEDPKDLFVIPEGLDASSRQVIESYHRQALEIYDWLVAENGVSKQLARYVLPNSTRTRIIAKMNLREWRHVLRLRMHTSAQPEMQQVARMIHAKLQRRFGLVLFPDDLAAQRTSR